MSNNTIPLDQSYKNLTRQSGEVISYQKLPANSPGDLPGMIFLPGFMSDMNGAKALAVENFARVSGQSFVRFDYFGHGNSSGNFVDGHMGIWASDTLAVLDELTKGPQILIGSSMGGWLMLLTAIARPERIIGLIGLAAAPDFTEDLLRNELSQDELIEVNERGFVTCKSQYEDDYIYTKALFDEGLKHLVLRDEMPIDCPVRLIHGLSDKVVPWQTAINIQEKIRGTDVEIILVKDGDHRLSTDSDLECLIGTIGNLINGF
jgi:pimeloyl-ACP methyl ester carboxylesterase